MALSSAQVAAAVLCATLGLWAWARSCRANHLPHPPGPPGLPLIGNLLDVPSPQGSPWETYNEWSRRYSSDIIRISVVGMNIVITNSVEATNELLEKRSGIYSDRWPQLVMLDELCGFGWGMGFLPYSESWRLSRKMANQELRMGAVERYRQSEQRATVQLMLKMHQHPDQLMENLRFHAGSAILSIAYDINVKSLHDPYITIAEAATESISQSTSAGSYFVDIFPFLKHVPQWVPGARFQTQAKVWKAAIDKSRDVPYERTLQRLQSGDLGDCAAKSLLEAYGDGTKDPQYIDQILRATLGSMYIGQDHETSSSALGSFFLAMTLYPEVQAKARKQLDQVVGTQRLPNFSDRASLPYIDAIVKEALRWNPVVPINFPHMLTTDDVYNGYYLPKGTLVVANSWCFLHDEEIYHDPLAFNPNRFLRADGSLDPDVRDPSAAFGFGRRICVGRYLAIESMWIAIACVLSLFDIRKVVGEDGKEITPNAEYIRGFVWHPKPFPCVIAPRSKDHEALLMAAAELG
ncbi:cytochrome P450 [Earliella scabrosa]|nr:cytochrome P450 [Earliella scabrosa]